MIDKLIHLLREFPGSFLLALLFMAVLIPYVLYSLPFLERLLDLFAGGILSSVIGTAVKRTTVNTDTVQANDLNAGPMPGATINADSVNLDTKEK